MFVALLETIFLTGYSFMVNLHDLYHPINPVVEFVKDSVTTSKPSFIPKCSTVLFKDDSVEETLYMIKS